MDGLDATKVERRKNGDMKIARGKRNSPIVYGLVLIHHIHAMLLPLLTDPHSPGSGKDYDYNLTMEDSRVPNSQIIHGEQLPTPQMLMQCRPDATQKKVMQPPQHTHTKKESYVDPHQRRKKVGANQVVSESIERYGLGLFVCV